MMEIVFNSATKVAARYVSKIFFVLKHEKRHASLFTFAAGLIFCMYVCNSLFHVDEQVATKANKSQRYFYNGLGSYKKPTPSM